MNPDLTRDPERDAELAAALRGVLGDAPEPEWSRLHASVSARAELPLVRLRRGARPAPRWRRVRPLVPLAAAAGIAGAALAVTLRPAHEPPPLSDADLRMVDQIVESPLPDLERLLTGELAREEMIRAVGS